MPERSEKMKKVTLDEVEKVLDGKASVEESLDVLSAAAGNEELQELLTSEESGKDGRDIDFFNNMFTKYADEIKSFMKHRDKGKVLKVNFDQVDMDVAAAHPSVLKSKKKEKEMIADEFNQLWEEIAIMIDFEAKRIRNSSGKVNVRRIETYYKTEIVDKLWFSLAFPNKYNKWICDYYENSPAIQREIRESMDSFSPVSRGKQYSVLFVAGVVIFVLGLLSFLVPELNETISICLTLAGVVSGVWGFVKRSISGSCCEMSALSGELDRIKKQVNTIIHEHADR